MSSKRLIESNRQNAQNSTGPKTESGKKTSSKNALKHGLYSQDLIIDDPRFAEDPAEFELLLASITEDLEPDTGFQKYLVRKMAESLWRARRVITAESAHITRDLSQIDNHIAHCKTLSEIANKACQAEICRVTPEDEIRMNENLPKLSLVPESTYSTELVQYEMRLDHQFARLYRIYRQIKQTRLDRIAARDAQSTAKITGNRADSVQSLSPQSNPRRPFRRDTPDYSIEQPVIMRNPADHPPLPPFSRLTTQADIDRARLNESINRSKPLENSPLPPPPASATLPPTDSGTDENQPPPA